MPLSSVMAVFAITKWFSKFENMHEVQRQCKGLKHN